MSSCKRQEYYARSRGTKQPWCSHYNGRPPSKSEGGRCENEAFVRDVPQKVEVANVKTKLSCETSCKIWKLKIWKRSFRARPPPKRGNWRYQNEAFVRDVPPTVKVEDVKTKLSCETSLKIWKWKMWERSFRARVPQKVEVANVKTKLSCETSCKIWKLKIWKRSFRTRPPQKVAIEDIKAKLSPSKSEGGRCENEAFVRDVPQEVEVANVKMKLSCETSFKFWRFKVWK